MPETYDDLVSRMNAQLDKLDALCVKHEKMEQKLVTELNAALESLREMTAERDALAAQLAALKKRVADAERVKAMPPWNGDAANYYTPECGVSTPGTYALLRLEYGEK